MLHGVATVIAWLLTQGSYRGVMAGPFPLLPDTAPAWMRLLLATMVPVLAGEARNPEALLAAMTKAFVLSAVGRVFVFGVKAVERNAMAVAAAACPAAPQPPTLKWALW